MSVIWLAGLAAGFFGLLSAAAKYGCASTDRGLGCRTSGSILGTLVVVAVVAVVTLVTVVTHDQPTRRVVVVGIAGLVVLGACFVAARLLLATI